MQGVGAGDADTICLSVTMCRCDDDRTEMGTALSLIVVTAVVLQLTGIGLLVIGGGPSGVAALWVVALALIAIARVGERTAVFVA